MKLRMAVLALAAAASLNAGAASLGGGPSCRPGTEADIESVALRMDRFCRANPAGSVVQGAFDLHQNR
jgi:hypothetical protein